MKALLYVGAVSVLAFFAMTPKGQAQQAVADSFEPMAIYGKEARYLVLRDGQVVGRNLMTFENRGEEVVVTADMRLELKLLAFTIYSYSYRSQESWAGGRLKTLSVTVDDDGDKSSLSGSAVSGGFAFDGHGQMGEVEGLIFPTNHWNSQVLKQGRVLNTLTGSVNQVEILPQGREKVRANGRDIEATLYRYSGELDTEVWYDDEGRWVGMRFKAKDGSIITYQCEICRPAGAS